MTSFTNDDLYQIVLDRLRKDRKGAISPEEFESFLRNRNIDYFNQQMAAEGATKLNLESLRPFMVEREPCDVLTVSGIDFVWLLPIADTGVTTTTDTQQYLTYKCAHIINVFYGASLTDHSDMIEVDLVSHAELHDRLNNAITAPSATYPICYLSNSGAGSPVLYLYGTSNTNYILLTYYRYPADPYFDYYTDANGNITYLTDGQASYTLQAGEVSRDGSVAPAAVTSVSADLEWEDQDAMNILDMVMTDIAIAQSDQGVAQSSILERQQNVKA